jgi:outer membrane receptor for ferrienterochelin and colicin
MSIFRRLLCLLISLALAGSSVRAAVPANEVPDLGFNDLLKMNVSVASVKPSTLRESPGIVSVVTAEEIRKSGARDLIDILRMVPGFDFGVDVQGTVGIGARGNWAHEGKVSLRIDGQEMNELLYSTSCFIRRRNSAAIIPSTTSSGSRSSAGRAPRSTADTPNWP